MAQVPAGLRGPRTNSNTDSGHRSIRYSFVIGAAAAGGCLLSSSHHRRAWTPTTGSCRRTRLNGWRRNSIARLQAHQKLLVRRPSLIPCFQRAGYRLELHECIRRSIFVHHSTSGRQHLECGDAFELPAPVQRVLDLQRPKMECLVGESEHCRVVSLSDHSGLVDQECLVRLHDRQPRRLPVLETPPSTENHDRTVAVTVSYVPTAVLLDSARHAMRGLLVRPSARAGLVVPHTRRIRLRPEAARFRTRLGSVGVSSSGTCEPLSAHASTAGSRQPQAARYRPAHLRRLGRVSTLGRLRRGQTTWRPERAARW